MDNPIQILLVEDDPGDAELIERYLARSTLAGVRLEHIDQLADALDRIAEVQQDVIFLDLSLPDTCDLHTVLW